MSSKPNIKSTIFDLLLEATKLLQASSQSPRLDAELLLGHVLNYTHLDLIKNQNQIVETKNVTNISNLLERRKQQEPIAYILGYKEFYGRNFLVNSSVLCPRPETELLIEKALEEIKFLDKPINFLDLGCGSGCIALTLALEFEKLAIPFTGLAVDFSKSALEVTKSNIKKLNVNNVSLLESNWYASIDLSAKYNLIVSNPPYVQEGAGYSPELKYEPSAALYSGNQGLSDIYKILDSLFDFIACPGLFLCEIGKDQGQQVVEHATHCIKQASVNASARIHKDLAGFDRVLAVNISPKLNQPEDALSD